MKLVALIILIILNSLMAQPQRRMPHRLDPEMKEQIRNIRKWRLLEELELDDTQMSKFMPLMTRFDREQEELAQKQEKLANELDNMVFDENGNRRKISERDQKTILDKTLEFNKLKEEQCMLEVHFTDEVSEFLTPVQLYTLASFNERFHKEMRQLLRRFLQCQDQHENMKQRDIR